MLSIRTRPKAANDIFEAMKELKLKTIEDWYYDLIDDTEETMDLMKEIITEKESNARTKS